MTIAACHVSPEGVVLGADSTTTIVTTGGGSSVEPCHFDYAQKIFELGHKDGTCGLVTWGLGQIGTVSHRLRAARLDKRHEQRPFPSLKAMATAFAMSLQRDLDQAFSAQKQRLLHLADKLSRDPDDFTLEDRREATELLELSGGFCLAGRLEDCTACEAYEIEYDLLRSEPKIRRIPDEVPIFWGVPHFMQRLMFGFDEETLTDIATSPKWQGDISDLMEIVQSARLAQPTHLPIRDAIDWIHTVIHTTIRGVKFAKWRHICGGPIEIAVVTADRPFRWVRHKRLDSAILTAQEERI